VNPQKSKSISKFRTEKIYEPPAKSEPDDDYKPEYDPINRPFTPVKSHSRAPITPDEKPETDSKKHPLVYGLIAVALLLPFVILVTALINPIGEFFQDFQKYTTSLSDRPSLTPQELIQTLNRFFEQRNNH